MVPVAVRKERVRMMSSMTARPACGTERESKPKWSWKSMKPRTRVVLKWGRIQSIK